MVSTEGSCIGSQQMCIGCEKNEVIVRIAKLKLNLCFLS